MKPNLNSPSKLSDSTVREKFKSMNPLISVIESISMQDLLTIEFRSNIRIPYPLETVAAGFPSPAQDYTEKKIDLNEHLIHNPIATFMLKVNSLSMKNAGIEIGDEILIDRSLEAEHGDIVLALINNEFTVKRFMQVKVSTGIYDIWLKAERGGSGNLNNTYK
ncbi:MULTISPECIES: LexA family protein [unclassified Acinetobacter]|uniref:LexA family protein n=1 Tax=unclassified Acinetobacter TaxID=196816 RepID=UPI003AF5356C